MFSLELGKKYSKPFMIPIYKINGGIYILETDIRSSEVWGRSIQFSRIAASVDAASPQVKISFSAILRCASCRSLYRALSRLICGSAFPVREMLT